MSDFVVFKSYWSDLMKLGDLEEKHARTHSY